MFYFMKRNLLFLMLGLSSFLFFSCSSNDDECGGNDKYYIKYSMRGGLHIEVHLLILVKYVQNQAQLNFKIKMVCQ